jgi:protein lifeguard
MYSQPLINIDPNQPKSSIVDDFMFGNNVANSHVTVRLGFIRKVYGILSVQLTFTAIISFFIMYFDSVSGFIKEK